MIDQKMPSSPKRGVRTKRKLRHPYQASKEVVRYEAVQLADPATIMTKAFEARRGLASNSLIRNGLPAMVGAFAAAVTAGVAAAPALGLSVLTGLGFTWLNGHNRPT